MTRKEVGGPCGKGRLLPLFQGEEGPMDNRTIAVLLEEGGKVAGDLIRVHLSRPVKVRARSQVPATEQLLVVPVLAQGAAAPPNHALRTAAPPSATPGTAVEACPTCLRERPRGTACLACARDHLATVSGALGEAVRFARAGGVGDPEAQRRLALAEEEVAIMERIDLAPDALAALSPEEKELAEAVLVRGRGLRQELGEVKDLEGLERVAASASLFRQEFRLQYLQLKGIDLKPVFAVVKDVQEGRLSMEEGREKVKALLPQEEEVERIKPRLLEEEG